MFKTAKGAVILVLLLMLVALPAAAQTVTPEPTTAPGPGDLFDVVTDEAVTTFFSWLAGLTVVQMLIVTAIAGGAVAAVIVVTRNRVPASVTTQYDTFIKWMQMVVDGTLDKAHEGALKTPTLIDDAIVDVMRGAFESIVKDRTPAVPATGADVSRDEVQADG